MLWRAGALRGWGFGDWDDRWLLAVLEAIGGVQLALYGPQVDYKLPILDFSPYI